LESESRDQLRARIKERCPCCPTPPLPHPSPVVAGCGRSSSTDRSGAQSSYRPLTGSRKPPYVGSLRGSSDAALGHRTAIERGEIGVMAHQILAHRTSCMPRCIATPKHGTQDPRIHATIICLTRFCRCSCMTSDVVQPNSTMDQKGRRDDTL
jgi:hypothetical protein